MHNQLQPCHGWYTPILSVVSMHNQFNRGLPDSNEARTISFNHGWYAPISTVVSMHNQFNRDMQVSNEVRTIRFNRGMHRFRLW